MKFICEKIKSCIECPYYTSPNGTFGRCNNFDGPEEKLSNLYIWNEIHPKCPLKDIEVID